MYDQGRLSERTGAEMNAGGGPSIASTLQSAAIFIPLAPALFRTASAAA